MPHTKLARFPSISDSCVNARPNDHKLGSLYQKKDQGVRHHMTLLQVVQLKVVLSDSKANRERCKLVFDGISQRLVFYRCLISQECR